MTETIAQVVGAHANGKPVVATIEEIYARIARHDDPALFITLRAKSDALAAAERLSAGGPAGKPLYGVPFAVKDNIDVAGLPTTAACPAFAYTPTRSAFVVEALERAGAIPIGKTNLDQFATGLVGVRSPYGAPRNALRADLVPGGSSAGSATAVGAGLVPFSLGTDTAGSGRVPAALNGIVGLKPSLGALSSTGLVPACRTLDTISIFAPDVFSAFAAFQAACGYDEQDAYSRRFPRPELSAFPRGVRFGVPRAGPARVLRRRRGRGGVCARRQGGRGARGAHCRVRPRALLRRRPPALRGPWVAERYAATKPLIETNPEALHPVTRAIIEGAKNSTRSRPSRRSTGSLSSGGGRWRRGRRSTSCSFRPFRAPTRSTKRWPSRSCSIPASGPTPTSSTFSISALSPFPPGGAGTDCLRA